MAQQMLDELKNDGIKISWDDKVDLKHPTPIRYSRASMLADWTIPSNPTIWYAGGGTSKYHSGLEAPDNFFNNDELNESTIISTITLKIPPCELGRITSNLLPEWYEILVEDIEDYIEESNTTDDEDRLDSEL